jgi:hypothetical protein
VQVPEAFLEVRMVSMPDTCHISRYWTSPSCYHQVSSSLIGSRPPHLPFEVIGLPASSWTLMFPGGLFLRSSGAAVPYKSVPERLLRVEHTASSAVSQWLAAACCLRHPVCSWMHYPLQ